MSAQATCTRCGTLLPLSLRFCDVCGEELTRPAPLPPRLSEPQDKLRRECGFWLELYRAMMRADLLRLQRSAREAVARMTSLDSARMAQVEQWIAHAQQHPVSLKRAAEAVSTTLSSSERLSMFHSICQACWVDDARLSMAEIVALKDVAEAFGLSDNVQRSAIADRFGLTSVCEYMLGVVRTAPPDVIQHAYVQARRKAIGPPSNSGLERPRNPERLQQLSSAYRELMQLKRP